MTTINYYTDDKINWNKQISWNKQIEGKELLCKEYWENGKLHRLDGPAVEYADGYKAYWINGKKHRLDGPAIESMYGIKEYFVNDVYVTDKIKDIPEKDIPKYLKLLSL